MVERKSNQPLNRNDEALKSPDKNRSAGAEKWGGIPISKETATLIGAGTVTLLLLGAEATLTEAQDMIQQDDDLEPTSTPDPMGNWNTTETPAPVTPTPTPPQETLVAMVPEAVTTLNPTATRDNPTATPTATATSEHSTPTPTPIPDGATPTPGETLVAMVPAEASFVTSSQLERGGFPSTVHWERRAWNQEGDLVIDAENTRMVVNGQEIPMGVHFELPASVEDALFGYEYVVNAQSEQPVYIVGVVANVIGQVMENGTYVEGEILVAVPNNLTHQFSLVEVRSWNPLGTRISTFTRDGRVVGLPPLDNQGNTMSSPNSGVIRTGTNPETSVVWTGYPSGEKAITFPTAEGVSQLNIGDPIIVRAVLNDEIFSDYGTEQYRLMSGNRTPAQALNDIMDGITQNDGRIVLTSRSFATIFSPPEQ